MVIPLIHKSSLLLFAPLKFATIEYTKELLLIVSSIAPE
jgi:hypothetical protein